MGGSGDADADAQRSDAEKQSVKTGVPNLPRDVLDELRSDVQTGPAQGGEGSGPQSDLQVLDSLDWSSPATSANVAYATSETSSYERQMLGNWCGVIDSGDSFLEADAAEREHDAMALLRQCEYVQQESEAIENKR
jgi:hypothetical protein